MADLQAIIVAAMRGGSLSLGELLHTLQLEETLGKLIRQAVLEKLLPELAVQEGVAVGDEELQQTFDDFRQEANLQKAADLDRWLLQRHLTLDDLEIKFQRALLKRKIKDKVAQGRVERTFAESRTKYDRAQIAQILVAKIGVARELLSQIQEDGMDFATLAQRYSIHQESKQAGGSLGMVPRKSLSPALESAVFTARPGQVVGPIKTNQGYHLVKIEEILLGQLDDTLKETIANELFDNWLREQERRAQIKILWPPNPGGR